MRLGPQPGAARRAMLPVREEMSLGARPPFVGRVGFGVVALTHSLRVLPKHISTCWVLPITMPQTVLPKNVTQLLDQVALDYEGDFSVESIGKAIQERHEKNWKIVNKVVG